MVLEPNARLTSRDILSKTFSAKTRRGYSPIGVDRFLRRVADGVDELNREVDRLMFGGEAGDGTVSELPPPPPPEILAAYQQQTAAGEPLPDEPAAIEPPQFLVAEEAVELLRMAKETADRTMAEARLRGESMVVQARAESEQILATAQTRADEIVADATLRGSEITRDADRKAFEAATRRRAEVAEIERQVETRRVELDELHRAVSVTGDQLRGLARQALDVAGEELPDVVVDLTERRPDSSRSQHPAYNHD